MAFGVAIGVAIGVAFVLFGMAIGVFAFPIAGNGVALHAYVHVVGTGSRCLLGGGISYM